MFSIGRSTHFALLLYFSAIEKNDLSIKNPKETKRNYDFQEIAFLFFNANCFYGIW